MSEEKEPVKKKKAKRKYTRKEPVEPIVTAPVDEVFEEVEADAPPEIEPSISEEAPLPVLSDVKAKYAKQLEDILGPKESDVETVEITKTPEPEQTEVQFLYNKIKALVPRESPSNIRRAINVHIRGGTVGVSTTKGLIVISTVHPHKGGIEQLRRMPNVTLILAEVAKS